MGKRGSFSSKFGTMAAVGGSVIGLGNIWRFPYVTGQNGGGAFLLIFIIVSLVIAVPIMLSEFVIGRSTKRNSKRAFQKLVPKQPYWKWVGYMGILCAFVILSFYNVIAGWAMKYIFEAASNNFSGQTPGEAGAVFSNFVNSGWQPILWSLAFILVTAWIVWAGIEKGIEKYCKVLIPLFFLFTIGLAINSMTLPGAGEGINFLLSPDFSKVTGRTVLEALGQAFFSMSLGMGCMITYGSYMKKEENMFQISSVVVFTSILLSILAGLIIFPAVFSFGISPSSGPELVFLTLPSIFSQMTGGYFIAIIFFFLIFVAAITSSISLFEVGTAYLSEEMQLGRKKSVVLVTLTSIVTSSLCALSQMEGSPLVLFGKNLFDCFDGLASNILMPVGGLFIVIFTGWVMLPSRFKNELTNHNTVGTGIYQVVRFLIKFVIPIFILIIFLNRLGLF